MGSILSCKACFQSDQVYKQGDNALVVLRLCLENGDPFVDLSSYDVTLTISSGGVVYKRYKWENGGEKSVQIDKDGYIAFDIPSSETCHMLGNYYLEGAISSSESSILMPRIFALEIVPSITHKLIKK